MLTSVNVFFSRTTQYHAELIVECPITAKGQYELGGKLFVIDVYGSGDFEIKTGILNNKF